MLKSSKRLSSPILACLLTIACASACAGLDEVPGTEPSSDDVDLGEGAGAQTATSVRFAAIGDYGFAGPAEAAVANLVRSWNPDHVITLGDNNYEVGSATTIDANVGQYYRSYIFPYTGSYGPGATTNRFWPALGNHDWGTPGATPYLAYFTLPTNGAGERYYQVVQGPVHFFVLDSDPAEPHGTSSTSIQAQWLRAALAASTAPWKIVYFHHAPYSSGNHGSTLAMRWPFQAWGAHAVLAGHDHHYERFSIDGIPYFVNGLGGRSLYPLNATLPGSLVRYNAAYGAMLVDASATAISFQFITTGGAVIDALTLTKAATTYTLSVTAVNGAVARSPNQPTYAAGAAVTLTATPSAGYQFVGWSGDATGTTNPLSVTMTASKGITANFAAIGASRYVSDLAWVPLANAWGPVEKDRSNGGQLAGDGRVLTINGATYAKGLGVTARAEVTVPLGGAYRTFTSDVGIDDEVGLTGSAVFVVVVDGVERYRSATLTGASAKVAVAVDITGAQTLRLIVEPTADGGFNDYADWAGARVTP